MRGKYLRIAIAVGLGFAIKPLLLRLRQWSVTAQNTHSAEALACVLKLYASDHDGAYPSRLNDLISDYISSLKGLLYSELNSDGLPGAKYDWLYFGSGFDEKHAPHVIIASPRPMRVGRALQRIVMYDDQCAAAVIPEDQYRRELRQINDKMRNAPAPDVNATAK